MEGIRYFQQVLLDIQKRNQADRDTAKQSPVQAQQRRQKDPRALQTQRMQQYWDSGDPILMAEAQRWARANPGVLNLPTASDHQSQQEEPSILAVPPIARQVEPSVRLTAASEALEQESAVPIDEESLEVADLSDVLAQISVQKQRLD